jgi:CBS domain-containing protein
MTKDVITVPPDEKIIDAFELMQVRGIRHLPVVENGELRGLVTTWVRWSGSTKLWRRI